MKKLAIALALISAALIAQTTTTKWIYGYVGNKAQWFTLGPTLTVSATGQLDAVVATDSPFTVERTSATTLTVRGCSSARPCNYAFGIEVGRVTDSPAITLTNGSGELLIYLDRTSGLTVAPASTMAVTCAGCVSVPGVPVFPWDSIPLYRWKATSGAWDSAGVDLRVSFRRELILPGDGVSIVRAGAVTTVSITPPGQ